MPRRCACGGAIVKYMDRPHVANYVCMKCRKHSSQLKRRPAASK